jgi:hypothetical protein
MKESSKFNRQKKDFNSTSAIIDPWEHDNKGNRDSLTNSFGGVDRIFEIPIQLTEFSYKWWL